MDQASDRNTKAAGEPPTRRWGDFAGRSLFEIMIVAIGVVLALAVDQWREDSEQREIADDARQSLRAEIITNRDAVFARMRRIARLYADTTTQPERVSQYVFDRRNMALLIDDSAWTMVIETGALRWLSVKERTKFADIYAGQQRMRDVVQQEMTVWAELAAFQPPLGADQSAERDRAILVWKAFAQRAQLAHCASAARYEQALGGKFPASRLVEFCRDREPTEDPSDLYRLWQQRGWAGDQPPRIVRPPAPPPSS